MFKEETVKERNRLEGISFDNEEKQNVAVCRSGEYDGVLITSYHEGGFDHLNINNATFRFLKDALEVVKDGDEKK